MNIHFLLTLVLFSPTLLISKIETKEETSNTVFLKISKRDNKQARPRIEKKKFPYADDKAAAYYVNTWPSGPKSRPPHYP